MATQYGIKYAVHLINKHFGDLVAKVCECLLLKGPVSLGEVIKHTELSQLQAKNSLLVLIQHNCVQAFLPEEQDDRENGPKEFTLYMALFDNILHRARFPKFLAIVSEEFDKQCAELFEGLLEHGRLSQKQMFDRVNSSKKEGNKTSMDAVQENLRKLVMAHYVERCPNPEPVLTAPTEEEAPARKRGSKASKKTTEPESLERQVLAVAVPVEAKRFSFVMSDALDANGEENNSACKHVGEKRKLDSLESNVDGAVKEQVILWRANFEEFVRKLRHKVCIETVRAQMDDGAAIVLTAMLQASRSEEKKVKIENSVPLSLNSIYEEVIKSENGRNMTFDHVRTALMQLSSPPPFVRVVDESYVIDFKHIIEGAQMDEVESIVLKRHGRDAYKIFRLLSKAGRLLETDKISDTIFVEKKETAQILYKMWQDEYVLMEKLVAGTTPFLLWKVNKNTLWKHVLDEMFHAALNLCIRVAHEMDEQNEIANIPQDRIEGELKDKYRRLVKVRALLQSSWFKLDDAVMLFHDF